MAPRSVALGRSRGVSRAPPPSGKHERPPRSISSSPPSFPATPGSPFGTLVLLRASDSRKPCVSEQLGRVSSKAGCRRLPGEEGERRRCLGEQRESGRALLEVRSDAPLLAAGLPPTRAEKGPRMPAEELNATTLKDARLKDLLFHRGIPATPLFSRVVPALKFLLKGCF